MKTVPAEITHADVDDRDDDRVLLLTLTFTDASNASVRYLFRESVHGNDVLFKLLQGIGYEGEKRFDRLFSDLIGRRLRARIDDEGVLHGVGHRLKNKFFMWEDHPVYPVE